MKIVRGWIDTAGRCRTWRLLDANGEPIAEVTTLKGAKALLKLIAAPNTRKRRQAPQKAA